MGVRARSSQKSDQGRSSILTWVSPSENLSWKKRSIKKVTEGFLKFRGQLALWLKQRSKKVAKMLPFGQLKVGSGVRIGRRGEKMNLAESSNILKDAAEKRNRRLSARRASFSGLEDVYKDLDEVYQKDEELRQQERSRSRMQSEERTFGPERSRSRMQSEERTFGLDFVERSRSRMESEERSLCPQQGGVSGEDMMSALEEFRRRRGIQEKAGMEEGSNDEWGDAGKDWEWDDGTDEEAEKKKKEEKEVKEEIKRKIKCGVEIEDV